MQIKTKRERILDAAQVIFAAKGYHQAKMEEIAEQAVVGKGTLYEYFPSKQELFKEMFRVILSDYMSQVAAPNADQLTIKERVRHLVEMHLRYMINNRHHMPTSFGDLDGMDEDIMGWMYGIRQENIARMISIFEQGIARREIKGFSPELGANLLSGILRGLTIPVMMDQLDFEPDQVAGEVIEIMFHGMAR